MPADPKPPIVRRTASEPTIVLADCGCRFKAVTNLPMCETGSLAMVNPCVAHSYARTAAVRRQANKLECGCGKLHKHTRRGLCIEQGCQDCHNWCEGGCHHG